MSVSRCIEKIVSEPAAVVRFFAIFSHHVLNVLLGTFHILLPCDDMHSLTRQLHNTPFCFVTPIHPYTSLVHFCGESELGGG